MFRILQDADLEAPALLNDLLSPLSENNLIAPLSTDFGDWRVYIVELVGVDFPTDKFPSISYIEFN